MTSIVRQFIAVVICALLMGAHGPALANDEQSVEIVFGVLITAQSIAGVPLNKDEAEILKSLVLCALQGKTVLSCSKTMVVDRLPREVQALASCILGGVSLEQCSIQEGIRRLPPGSAETAQCIAAGRLAEQCASELLLRAIPPETRRLAECVSKQANFAACTSEASATPEVRQALAAINKFSGDARSQTTPMSARGTGTVRNILQIVEAVRDDDWITVSVAVGAELYKKLLTAAIYAAIPASHVAAPVIEPVIDYVVRSRADVAQSFMKALKSGDTKAIGEAVTSVYLLAYVVPVCGIKQIPDVIYEATCGNLGKILKGVASAGGEVLDAIASALRAIGNLPSEFLDAAERFHRVILGKDDDCGSPADHYRKEFASCYRVGAHMLSTAGSKFEETVSTSNQRCRDAFRRCYLMPDVRQICDPQVETFRVQVKDLSTAIDEWSFAYAKTFGGFARTRVSSAGFCSADSLRSTERDFVAQCSDELTKRFGAQPVRGSQTCGSESQAVFAPPVYEQACRRAMERVNIDRAKVVREACRSTLRPPSNCSAAPVFGCSDTVSIKCDAPLPGEIEVLGSSGRPMDKRWLRVHTQEGSIVRDIEGAASIDSVWKVCSTNGVDRECGGGFEVKQRTCPAYTGPTTPPPCPRGETKCSGRCVPIGQCRPPP